MLEHSIKKLSAKPISFRQNTTTKHVFSVIAEQPWAMWLDSCKSDHVDSRYDIMVWQPIITISTSGDTSTIHNINDNTQIKSNDDPLFIVKHEQEKLFQQTVLSSSELPFKGGAIGYFSYDLGRRFEKISKQNIKDIDVPDMSVGIYQQAIIYDKKTEGFWLLCDENERIKITDFFNQKLYSLKMMQRKNFSLTSTWLSNMTKEEYQYKFEQVQEYLQSGDCYQINLAQRFSAKYSGNEFEAYLALREENKAPFSAFIRFDSSAILSISPERFLKLKNKHVQSKPIKGTRPRSEDPVEDNDNAMALQHSSKDRAENLMIVDLLRNDISKVCQAGTVKVPSLFAIESFPAVHHLVSTVEGTLDKDADGSDLLRAAFPGGSITGAPKIRAMDIIEELEPHQRSVYCGSIGYISACGNMDSSITIRTLVCHDNKVHCWAGGGLVADSDVDSEYQETYDKVNKILPTLSNLN